MGTMRRIMVAIKDLDAASMPAVRKAAQLAMSSGATLELFHALSQSILIDALDARRISLADYEAEQIAAAFKRLEVIASACANTTSKSSARPSGTFRPLRRSSGAPSKLAPI